ncbi:hypothetical protein [Thalassotalea marina]|uniref:DUF3718 domain-containing protein n=1 Tax=Thalassotalea marina TaxID=1673741 RepID=A0A919ELC1_9GAMM|nr:hypothetical protein [Thalassotalea marina]GHF93682.1 hypothetical protein GCM10017161_22740 [Thalassotalea marina]
MYKSILAAVAVLSFSQAAVAEKSEIFNCVDKSTMTFEQQCVAKTLEKHTVDNKFFDQLANKKYEPKQDAFAKLTFYPKENLITVVSLESTEQMLLLANN